MNNTEIKRRLPIFSTEALESEQRHTSDPDNNQDTIVFIDPNQIIPNRCQPRSSFNQNAIQRLADSIQRYGILQPLTVRKVLAPENAGKTLENGWIYELIAGERRLRAAKALHLPTVPCIIISTDDATSAELAIVENLLREDLNMFEQAEAFSKLITEFHLTQDEAARRVSMSQSAVANKLRLLKLSESDKKQILEGNLTERHARALLKIEDPALRAHVIDHIISSKMNVSTSEAYIDNILCEMARLHSRRVIADLSDTVAEVSTDFFLQNPVLRSENCQKGVENEQNNSSFQRNTVEAADSAVNCSDDSDTFVSISFITDPVLKSSPIVSESSSSALSAECQFASGKNGVEDSSLSQAPKRTFLSKEIVDFSAILSKAVFDLKQYGYFCQFKQVGTSNRIVFTIAIQKKL